MIDIIQYLPAILVFGTCVVNILLINNISNQIKKKIIDQDKKLYLIHEYLLGWDKKTSYVSIDLK